MVKEIMFEDGHGNFHYETTTDVYSNATIIHDIYKRYPDATDITIKNKYFKNKCKCLNCGDVIESKHTHDWVQCGCGAIYTDGGLDYCHRGWDPKYGSHDDVLLNIVEEITPAEYEVYNIHE